MKQPHRAESWAHLSSAGQGPELLKDLQNSTSVQHLVAVEPVRAHFRGCLTPWISEAQLTLMFQSRHEHPEADAAELSCSLLWQHSG